KSVRFWKAFSRSRIDECRQWPVVRGASDARRSGDGRSLSRRATPVAQVGDRRAAGRADPAGGAYGRRVESVALLDEGRYSAGAVRLIAGWLAIRRLLAGSRIVDQHDVSRLLAELRQALAVTRTIDLRESDQLTTAATVGWRRPAILLPREWRGWTNGELRAV